MTAERIEIAPTWEGVVPLLVHAAERGKTPEARRAAMAELLRLARIVDERNAEARKEAGK